MKRVLLALLTLLLLPAAALANGGPVSHVGDVGGPPVPITSSTVRVVREQLSFDVAADLKTAAVRAAYTLKNEGSEAADLTIRFEAAALRSDAEITWQGRPVTAERLEPASPRYPQGVSGLYFVNPVTGELRTISSAGGMPTVSDLIFPLRIAAGEEGVLLVRYRQEAGFDRRSGATAHHVYHYLLSPAQRWAGFGELTIEITLPQGTQFASNLAFEGTDTRTAHFSGLPGQELSFALAQPSPLAGLGLGQLKWLVAALIVLVPTVLAYLAGRGGLKGGCLVVTGLSALTVPLCLVLPGFLDELLDLNLMAAGSGSFAEWMILSLPIAVAAAVLSTLAFRLGGRR